MMAVACGTSGTQQAGPTAPDPGQTAASPTAAAASTPPSERRARPPEAPAVPGRSRTAAANAQFRGVWAHLFDDTIKTRAGIERMLDLVDASGFNSVLVEVVRRQDAYYDSDVLPRTSDPALAQGLDVLAATINGARARGLEVHAWYPVLTAYHPQYEDLPWPDGWVWKEHGRAAPESERWVTRAPDGEWGEYLDAGVPAVREHVVAVVREIATRYDVDAVHLDYLRYPEGQWGYHPVALERFRAETGRAGVPSPNDPEWSAWRRQQTHELATMIRRAVREAAPDVAVSAAVIAWGPAPGSADGFAATRAFSEVFQDWPSWLRDGLVDLAIPMVYVDAGVNPGAFEGWARFVAPLARDHGLAMGMAAYLNSPEASLAQVRTATDVSDGVAVYSYQQTASVAPREALLDLLRRGPFAEPATPR